MPQVIEFNEVSQGCYEAKVGCFSISIKRDVDGIVTCGLHHGLYFFIQPKNETEDDRKRYGSNRRFRTVRGIITGSTMDDAVRRCRAVLIEFDGDNGGKGFFGPDVDMFSVSDWLVGGESYPASQVQNIKELGVDPA